MRGSRLDRLSEDLSLFFQKVAEAFRKIVVALQDTIRRLQKTAATIYQCGIILTPMQGYAWYRYRTHMQVLRDGSVRWEEDFY